MTQRRQTSQEGRQIRLDRIVEILELAASTREGIRLSDVAAGLGIPVSTAYRLLAEMRRVGMLEAANGRGRHTLSAAFARLGRAAELNEARFASVEPYASVAADRLGETIYLTEMKGRVVSLVGFRRPSTGEGLHPGNAFPVHASAAGKILWSFRDDDELKLELERPHTKFRTTTHVDPEEIRAELERVRRRGFGVHDEEWDEGVYTMAVPIFAGHEIPAFAVGVIAEKERLLASFSEQAVFETLCDLRDELEKNWTP